MADEKKKNRKNKTEARVPVEEDLDLFGDHKPRRRVPRFIYRVALILLLCTVGLTLWLNRDNISLEGFWGWAANPGGGDRLWRRVSGFDYRAGNRRTKPGSRTNNQPAIVSDTEIMIFNSTAKELLTAQHSCASPVLCEAGGRYLVYDQGGTTYQIVSAQKVLKKGHSKQTIYAAALAGNGRWALATASQDYMSELGRVFGRRHPAVPVPVRGYPGDGGLRCRMTVPAGGGGRHRAKWGAGYQTLSFRFFSGRAGGHPMKAGITFCINCPWKGTGCAPSGDNSALTVAFGDEAPSEYTYNGTLCDAALHGDRMVPGHFRYTGGTDIVEFDGGNDPITQFSVTGRCVVGGYERQHPGGTDPGACSLIFVGDRRLYRRAGIRITTPAPWR